MRHGAAGFQLVHDAMPLQPGRNVGYQSYRRTPGNWCSGSTRCPARLRNRGALRAQRIARRCYAAPLRIRAGAPISGTAGLVRLIRPLAGMPASRRPTKPQSFRPIQVQAVHLVATLAQKWWLIQVCVCHGLKSTSRRFGIPNAETAILCVLRTSASESMVQRAAPLRGGLSIALVESCTSSFPIRRRLSRPCHPPGRRRRTRRRRTATFRRHCNATRPNPRCPECTTIRGEIRSML